MLKLIQKTQEMQTFFKVVNTLPMIIPIRNKENCNSDGIYTVLKT